MLDFPPLDPGIEIVVASRGISKGIAQTEGPQLVAKPFVQLGPVQLGAQWKNVSSAVAGGEAAGIRQRCRPSSASSSLSLGIAYKFQTGVREPTDDHSWEFTGSVTRKFGNLGLRVAAIYSPDDLGSAKRSLFMSRPGQRWRWTRPLGCPPVSGAAAASTAIDYTAFNAGLAKTIFKGVTVDARWYDTNRSGLGFPYRGRGVVSARMAF